MSQTATPSAYSQHIRLLLDKADSIGVSGRSILRTCGFSCEVSQIGSAGGVRLARRDFVRLRETCIQRIRKRLADPAQSNMSRDDFNFMCHSLISALTLHEVVERVCQFFELTDGRDGRSILSLEVDELASFEIRLGQVESGWATFFLVNAFLLFSKLFGWMIGDDLGCTYQVQDLGTVEDRMIGAIFGIEIEFGAPANRILFPAIFLGRAVIRDGGDLRDFLTTFPFDPVLSGESASQISAQVESLYRSAVAKGARPPGSKEIARILGMSRATLRRSLSRESCSLRQIKENVRRGVALSYLESGRGSSAELARKLGFADQKSFERAFRNWTGTSPVAFRRNAVRAPEVH